MFSKISCKTLKVAQLTDEPKSSGDIVQGRKMACGVFVLDITSILVDIKFIRGLLRLKFYIDKNKERVLSNLYLFKTLKLSHAMISCKPHIKAKYWPLNGKKQTTA